MFICTSTFGPAAEDAQVGTKKQITIVIVLITTIIFAFLLMVNRRTPHYKDVLSKVPLGTEVSSLNDLAKMEMTWGGSVVQWTVPSSPIAQPSEKHHLVKNDFGTFQQKALGDYANWHPTDEERMKFSGVVLLFLDQGFSNSVVLEFTFVNGRLIKKDWNLMPG